MRTILLIACISFGIFPAKAQQSVLEKRISLTLNAVAMENAVEKIAERADVNVSYEADLFKHCEPVTIAAENQMLVSVLNELFSSYKISYTVHAGQLILFPKKTRVVKEYQLTGTISNETTGVPVSYATLQIQGKAKGVIADHTGFFELTLTEAELSEKLVASCMGYERRTYAAHELRTDSKVSIQLKEKPIDIEPVVVTTPRLYKKNKTWGNRNRLTTGSIYLDTHGQQIALYIDNKKNENGYIQKVSYHLSDKGNVEAPFRVRILTVDPATQAPVADLIPEILVAQPPLGTDGWFDVDVSEYRIRVPQEGFFVAMQGVFPNDYSFYAGDSDFFEIGKRQPKAKNEFTPKSIHYGQRVGYSGKNGRDTWHYSLSHQWFQMEGSNYSVKISAEIGIYSKK